MTQKSAVLSSILYSAELVSSLFPDTGYIAEVFTSAPLSLQASNLKGHQIRPGLFLSFSVIHYSLIVKHDALYSGVMKVS